MRERREHPRIDGTALAAAVYLEDAASAERPSLAVAQRIRSCLARLFARPEERSHGAGRVAARRALFPDIADRLEQILAELDALEAWREASDVCSAIERLRARTD